MHPYPHTYTVKADCDPEGRVALDASGLPNLQSAPPKEFDGPGDKWSPETLLAASLAGCFVLTFRAIARASKLEFKSVQCSVEGVLERKDNVAQFTRFTTRAKLVVAAGANQDQAKRMLERAEHTCLIANSVKGERKLEATIETA